MINCQLNFKESVSILHYCRLVFKYLHIYKGLTSLKKSSQQHQYAILGHFLLLLLEEMHREIVNRNVKYEGENT